MKVVCVGDAYITEEMMRTGVGRHLSNDDTLETFYFGESDRGSMRDTVKAIEAHHIEDLKLPEGLKDAVSDCDILIVHLCPVTRKLIEKARNLKAVLSCRGGSENIDIEAANEKGIIVTVYPAHNANAVAEYTIGLMLCETRNISRADAALKKGIWREKYPNTETTIREIRDMTVGIVGFGSVGRLVAEKLKAFGCRIYVHDLFLGENAYDMMNFEFVEMHELLEKSDIITIHARAKDVIIGEKEFAKMKPTAYFINTARSMLVDTKALENAIKNHKILGAAIDVFDTEPHIPEFYRQYDNITITNHRGGDTINSYKDAPEFVIHNYFNHLKGEPFKFWINKK